MITDYTDSDSDCQKIGGVNLFLPGWRAIEWHISGGSMPWQPKPGQIQMACSTEIDQREILTPFRRCQKKLFVTLTCLKSNIEYWGLGSKIIIWVQMTQISRNTTPQAPPINLKFSGVFDRTIRSCFRVLVKKSMLLFKDKFFWLPNLRLFSVERARYD